MIIKMLCFSETHTRSAGKMVRLVADEQFHEPHPADGEKCVVVSPLELQVSGPGIEGLFVVGAVYDLEITKATAVVVFTQTV